MYTMYCYASSNTPFFTHVIRLKQQNIKLDTFRP